MNSTRTQLRTSGLGDGLTRRLGGLAAALAWWIALPAPAFPPVPHHVIYGCVRDEYGTPLTTGGGFVLLETPAGVQIPGTLIPGLAPGVNYQLIVPMDAGLTADAYEPAALKTSAQFKLVVVIGSTTNLPIQMSGNFSALGTPGQQTRLDLTLGVDSNGNGIPDAWEYAFLAALGLDLDLTNLLAGVDYAHDGRTLQQEFFLGTYPFDPTDSFRVSLVALNGASPLLQITTMTGRSYTPLGSADLKTWVPMSFTIPAEGPQGATHSFYYAPDIRTLQVQAIPPPTGPTLRFFRLLLQ